MHKIAKSRASQAFTIPTGTLCPFLYQTRTISHRRDQSSSTSRHTHHDEDSTLTFLQRKARDVETRRALESTLTTSERETFLNIMKNFGARIDGISLPPPPLPSEPLRPSRSRPANTELVEDLKIRLETPSSRATNQDINDILSLFAPVETNQQFSIFSKNADESESEPDTHQPTPQDTRSAAMTALQNISSSLREAISSSANPPDAAVWHVLETSVFPLITLLQADHNPTTTNPYQRTLSSLPSEELPSCLYSLNPDTPLLPLITILYPAATLLALRTYIAHLPSSGHALALLPKIRSLGPASYLLAGNTHFFNALLYLHWAVYSDLRTIYTLLGEMKRNGMEYDQGTLAQIEEMKRQRNEDLKGVEGSDGGRSRRWWTMRTQEEAWRGVMKRYQFDVLRQRKKEKRREEGMEENEMDHEIM